MSALREQAAGTADAQGPGFADAVWRFQHGGEELVLSEPWARLCEAFQSLVAQPREWTRSGVPLEVSYAVAEILSSALALVTTGKGASARQELAAFAWYVACGWEAVLAGDVDDVADHVANEARAREIPLPR